MKDKDIGGYMLREKLGAGVLGETWRAEETQTHENFAVKILDDKLLEGVVDIDAIFMGLENARKFYHPNIATPITWGTCKETQKTYIVSEYVPGPSMQVLQDGEGGDDPQEFAPLTLADVLVGREQAGIEDSLVLKWITQMLDAMVYQEFFLLHGNIKPSNVLIDNNDDIKITDMGIATAVDTSFFVSHVQHLSRPSDPAEDIAIYIAPELNDQSGNAMTQQSDVFAFGKLVEVMLKYLVKEKYPAFSEQVSYEQFKTAIQNCTARPPEERFEELRELERFLTTGGPDNMIKSNQMIIFLLVMLLLFLIMLFLIFLD